MNKSYLSHVVNRYLSSIASLLLASERRTDLKNHPGVDHPGFIKTLMLSMEGAD